MQRSQKVNFISRYSKDWTVINVNLTWFCPVNCTYCHIATKGDRNDKSFLSRDSLIEECKVWKQYNIKEFRFTGGEPLSIGEKIFEYADIVNTITGKKPAILTSGAYINEEWLEKARGKFSGIYISIENPLEPIRAVVNNKDLRNIIKENYSDDLPLRYGLTLISASHFKNIEKIFDILYNNVDRSFMPQLDYPSLKNFIVPTNKELNDVYINTKNLFEKYGIIPYYFVNIIGSLNFLKQDIFRVVVNLNPEGKYDIFNSLLDAFKTRYEWLNYILEIQKKTKTCQECEWIDSCKHHRNSLMFDWCSLRKALFNGVYEGLHI